MQTYKELNIQSILINSHANSRRFKYSTLINSVPCKLSLLNSHANRSLLNFHQLSCKLSLLINSHVNSISLLNSHVNSISLLNSHVNSRFSTLINSHVNSRFSTLINSHANRSLLNSHQLSCKLSLLINSHVNSISLLNSHVNSRFSTLNLSSTLMQIAHFSTFINSHANRSLLNFHQLSCQLSLLNSHSR